MSLTQIKDQAATLSPDEQRELLAYLWARQIDLDEELRKEFARKIDDNDPAHWIELDEVEKRFAGVARNPCLEFRLLIDLEALTFLTELPVRSRRQVMNHLRSLQSSPESLSDAYTHDHVGRRIEISFIGASAIHYWIDSADRQIKIVRIVLRS